MASADSALYAELLTNIRQISLAASLPSPCDASTQISISSDCRTIQLKHRGSTSSLVLPAKVSRGSTLLPIQDKQKGSTSLSWRLLLDTATAPQAQQGGQIPWSATDLDPSSGVVCRHCTAGIVGQGSVKVWKDLPSENWAEMMEFWHCHKPDHHHHNQGDETGKAGEESLAARGYGASSIITAQTGVGFVDLTTFLFEESDCQNLTVSFNWCGITFAHRFFLSSPATFQIFLWGIKRVTKPAYTASMGWISIQMPNIKSLAAFLFTQAIT